MKTLIIHPLDFTTTFLAPIYAGIQNKTVIQGGITKSDLHELIQSHQRIIMCGHGSPFGLLNKGQFPASGSHIIDRTFVSSLKQKKNNIFIWCNADQFVQWFGLSGMNCGMFISEPCDARTYGFHLDLKLIDQSNKRFAAIMSSYINEPLEIIYANLLIEYEREARINPIASFNLERLYLSYAGIDLVPKIRFSEKLVDNVYLYL